MIIGRRRATAVLPCSARLFKTSSVAWQHVFTVGSKDGQDTAIDTHQGDIGTSTSISNHQHGSQDALVDRVRSSHLAPLFKTPPELERAMSRLQAARVDNPKRFRQMGKLLIQNMKKRTLSKHRGGIQPNFFDQKNGLRSLRGSRRQQEKRALRDLTNALFRESDLTYENIQDIIRSHPSHDLLKAYADRSAYHYQTRKLGPRIYNGLGALAYATSRLPSTYAAVRNVFNRLKISRRDDGWAPMTMLDFGAGPGTAAWAARSVWSTTAMQVTAVEISSSMADIGYEILRDVVQESANVSPGGTGREMQEEVGRLQIRWMPFLPREQKRMTKYDICVASYSLHEIDSSVERHRVLNGLVQSCQEYIVLIEPGTPHGFSIIEESKQYILRVSNKLGIPFHVASPCPHDGPCPLANQARSWCHFSQKHMRTDEQRIAVTSLTGNAPREAYRERFSYVILKRGPRKTIGDSVMMYKSEQEMRNDGGLGEITLSDRADSALASSRLKDMIQRIPNSRVLRGRKRKGHVILDLCSVLDQNGAYMGDDQGTILRQIVSKEKSKSFSDIGSLYKASKIVSQGDEWPLLYQLGSNATETPIIYTDEHETDNEETDDDDDWIDDDEWEELMKVAEKHTLDTETS